MLLAPQPFYQERGTPIAVDFVLKVLSERGDRVDVITYHEGDDLEYDNVAISRIPSIPFVHGIPPGLSWRKLVSDVFLFIKAMLMAFGGRYQLVHAVEEGALMALMLKVLFRIPYVYDMDSSFAQQIIDKHPRLRIFAFFLHAFERLAVKHAEAVVPVCEALAAIAEKYEPAKKIVVLHDVSLLRATEYGADENLRTEFGVSGPILMYVGNLERYQGINLLLESFAIAHRRMVGAHLFIIGGKPSDIERYRKEAARLGIISNLHLIGPRPIESLAGYLSQADILVSPRINGENTPMKLYSYLHSGRAVLATNLPTHTQILDGQVAMLAEPTPETFAEGMILLLEDEELRTALGRAGQRLIETQHTFPVFREKLNGLYGWLQEKPAEVVASS